MKKIILLCAGILFGIIIAAVCYARRDGLED